MEAIFVLLEEQYGLFKQDANIRGILYGHMVTLKYEKVSNAVRDFYAHIGTHFVSKLYFTNYIYGYGTLSFSDSSGNDEMRLGASAYLN